MTDKATDSVVDFLSDLMTNLLINTLNAELNPICHLLALLGAHHILHVSRIRVNTFVRREHRLLKVFPGVTGHSG